MFKFLCGHMFSIFLGIFLVMELLDHMITLFYHWRRGQTAFQSSCAILHLHQLCHFTSPHQGCGFSTSLLTFIIYLFDYSHPSACEVVSRGFDLHFSDS